MLKLEYKNYTLDFRFDAGTSRGIMKKREILIVKVYDAANPIVYGLGEAAPLAGLSIESMEDLMDEVRLVQKRINEYKMPTNEENALAVAGTMVSREVPSLRFAVEMALLDLLNGGKRLLFDNSFYRGERDIKINGLVWMGDVDFMKRQIDEKLAKGYRCIKMKVGAIDFEDEFELVKYIREKSQSVIIRLDANGGFKNNEAFKRISELDSIGIHSIEQPIRPSQLEAMQLICKRSPIPIAFDEELTGNFEMSQKQELLKLMRPHYVVLKPSLLGGFHETFEWIRLAENLEIGWWVTSALESNIGLNAISQFVGEFDDLEHQGLGTGQLYENNFASPLEINGEYLGYNIKKQWEIDLF